LSEGTYTLTGSDDPNIAVLKDASSQQTVAYWVNNPNGKGTWIVGSLAEAQAAESKGNGAKDAKHVVGEVAVTTGKVILYTALIVCVVGLVALLAAGAFAEGYNQVAAQNRPVIVEQSPVWHEPPATPTGLADLTATETEQHGEENRNNNGNPGAAERHHSGSGGWVVPDDTTVGSAQPVRCYGSAISLDGEF
jgi:hypothetical protein